MNFVMQTDERISLLFWGATGDHCNPKKEEKMPYMCFKKVIELNLINIKTPGRQKYCPSRKRIRLSRFSGWGKDSYRGAAPATCRHTVTHSDTQRHAKKQQTS